MQREWTASDLRDGMLNGECCLQTVPQPGPERFRQSFTSWTAYSMDCLFKLAACHAGKYPGRPLNIHIFEPSPPEL